MGEIDLRFLGEQVAQLQADMRDLKADVVQFRAEQLKMEAEQAQSHTADVHHAITE